MIELTDREHQILSGISRGYTSKQIAQQLYLSDHTVITYRKILFRKLNAHNAAALVRRGFELGMLKNENSYLE